MTYMGLMDLLIPSALIGHEDVLIQQSIIDLETRLILLDRLHTNGRRCGKFPLVMDLHRLSVQPLPHSSL